MSSTIVTRSPTNRLKSVDLPTLGRAARLAGVHGVTFETAKWEIALERMGHEVRLCAGEVDALRASARLVPPMHFAWPPAARVTAAAFDPARDPVAVRAEIERLADLLIPGPGDCRAGGAR